MNDALTNAWSAIAEFVPKFVGFLAILIIGFFVAKLITKAVDKVLTRVGFERLVDRSGAKQFLAGSDLDASAIVSKLIYYALILFVLQLAFGVFGPNPISDLLTSVIGFIPKVIVAIVIIIVAAAIASAVNGLITSSLSGLSYGRLLGTIASVAILALGVIAALQQIDVATAVTGPVLIAVLATIGGILVVGVGGGLIKPMQSRWEGWLTKAEAEAPTLKSQTAANAEARGGAQAGAQSAVPTQEVRGAQAPADASAWQDPNQPRQ